MRLIIKAAPLGSFHTYTIADTETRLDLGLGRHDYNTMHSYIGQDMAERYLHQCVHFPAAVATLWSTVLCFFLSLNSGRLWAVQQKKKKKNQPCDRGQRI